MKKTIFLLTLMAFLIPSVAHAYLIKNGPSVNVSKDEVVDGNLYAAGASITIDGQIKGDVFCAGQNININGAVDGDIFCAGHSLNINGPVGGSVRVAGNSLNINSEIKRNVMAFGASVYMSDHASAGWDMLIGAATADIKGKIGRTLHGGASQVNISGAIGGDVNLRMGSKNKKTNLIISKETNIGGNINYTSYQDASIDKEAKIKGKVTRHEPKIAATRAQNYLAYAWSRIYSLFTALVIGLVLIALWKDEIIKLTDGMLIKIWPSIGWGVVALFLTPIIVILLLITLIGAPLALILTGLWIIAVLLSKILVGITVGRKIMERLKEDKKYSLIAAMIVGIAISWIIFSLPVLGWLIALVAVWWGLGGIYLFFKKS